MIAIFEWLVILALGMAGLGWLVLLTCGDNFLRLIGRGSIGVPEKELRELKQQVKELQKQVDTLVVLVTNDEYIARKELERTQAQSALTEGEQTRRVEIR